MAEHIPTATEKRKTDVKFIHEQLKKHENDLRSAINQVENFPLCFLRVLGCNGAFSRSFSDAWCETERISASHAGALFKDWFDINILKQFLENGDFLYLDEDKKSLALLTLQKLADLQDTRNFILRNTEVWHGSVDIIMGCSVIDVEEDLQPRIDDLSSSSVEVNTSDLGQSRQEMVAEAIVVSNIQPGAPLIAVSKSEMKYFIYNLQNDILGESEEFGIEEIELSTVIGLCMEEIELSTVIGLWMEEIELSTVIGLWMEEIELSTVIGLWMEEIELSTVIGLWMEEIELSTVIGLWMAINDTVFGRSPSYSKLGSEFCSNFKTLMQQCDKLELYENDLHFFGCKRTESKLPKLQQVYAHVNRSGRPFILYKRADSPAR